MSYNDKLLNCSECGTEFILRAEEQRRIAAEEDGVEPQKCPACQANQEGRSTGSVKWFDTAKGYGFIKRDDGDGEVFVHCSEIRYPGPKVLYEGERVEFYVEYDRRGEKAVNVTGHDPFAR